MIDEQFTSQNPVFISQMCDVNSIYFLIYKTIIIWCYLAYVWSKLKVSLFCNWFMNIVLAFRTILL